MSFYIQMREETLEDVWVLYMRRTGPYGVENAAPMEAFKVWIKTHGFDTDGTVVIAVPLDDPYVTGAEKCRYDVCLVCGADRGTDRDGVKSRPTGLGGVLCGTGKVRICAGHIPTGDGVVRKAAGR